MPAIMSNRNTIRIQIHIMYNLDLLLQRNDIVPRSA